jgi:hypothetical protein
LPFFWGIVLFRAFGAVAAVFNRSMVVGVERVIEARLFANFGLYE